MSKDSDRPPEKRRRTDEDGTSPNEKALNRFEAMWDEDIEFSQADIQSLEVLETQAYSHGAKAEQQGSSVSEKRNIEVRREPTVTMATEFQLPPPRPPSMLYRKLSSTLSLARNSSSSTTTTYPSSLSTGTSSDLHLASSVSVSSHPSLDSGEEPRGDSRLAVSEEVCRLTAKLEVLEKEKSQAKDELCSRDGEIKILRSQFREKESELGRVKEDRLHSMDQMRSQKSTFEESLKTERDRAQTQVQFREQEFRELEERCRLLEVKLQSAPSPGPLPSPSRSPAPRRVKVQTSPSTRPPSPPPSPAAPGRTRHLTPPRARRNFPSSSSFMAEEISQSADPRPITSDPRPLTSELRPSTSDPRPSTSITHSAFHGIRPDGDSDMSRTTERRHARKHVMNSGMTRGEISGSTLVSHLLQHHHSGNLGHSERSPGTQGSSDHPTGSTCPPEHSLEHPPEPPCCSDQGLIAILHPPSTPPYLRHVQFDRDQCTFLSPVRSRRLTEFNLNTRWQDSGEAHSFVPEDHYLMAVRGLQDLLQTPAQRSAQHPSQTPAQIPVQTPAQTPAQIPVQTPAQRSDLDPPPSSSASKGGGNLSGAVLILPLINDYLSRYIDMLQHTSSSSSPSSLSGSQSSASLTRASLSGSSLESVTSSMGLLLRDCQDFANNLETLCLACLRTLAQLVVFSEDVRRSLMDKTDWNGNQTGISFGSSSSGECAMDTDGVTTSSSDTESMSLESRVTFRQLQDLNLLYTIVALSHPLHENYSIYVVEEALNIVLVLASQWSESHLVRLHTALSRGALSSCLSGRLDPSHVGVVTRAVQVLGQLTRSQKISQTLCTKSESCPLLHLYFLRSKLNDEIPKESKVVLYQQIVTCMTNLTSHQGNANLILGSNCHCSVEAARCLIACLLRLYEVCVSDRCDAGDQPCQGNRRDGVVQCLRDGLLLLHHLQPQLNYPGDRDYHLHHEYVTLVCGLSSLFRQLPGSQEAELNALSDLWDFEQDDSELSLDSDQDSMET